MSARAKYREELLDVQSVFMNKGLEPGLKALAKTLESHPEPHRGRAAVGTPEEIQPIIDKESDRLMTWDSFNKAAERVASVYNFKVKEQDKTISVSRIVTLFNKGLITFPNHLRPSKRPRKPSNNGSAESTENVVSVTEELVNA